MIGVSAGLVVALAATISLVAGTRSDPEAPVSSTVAQPATLVVPEPSASESTAIEPPVATFVVRANSEIGALRVAGKSIPLASPVDEVQLPALPKAGDSVE